MPHPLITLLDHSLILSLIQHVVASHLKVDKGIGSHNPLILLILKISKRFLSVFLYTSFEFPNRILHFILQFDAGIRLIIGITYIFLSVFINKIVEVSKQIMHILI